MVDSYLVLFDRALAQALSSLNLGLYKANGTYTEAEDLPTRPPIVISGPDLPTSINNAIALNQLDPIVDGRANLTHRVQIISRTAGTRVQSRNLAWALFTALDHKEQIPQGFNISWSWLLSELHATADSQGRYVTYQTFYFRGRRPL